MFTQFIVELIVELTWRYITVIYTDDDYGLSMHSLLKQRIQVKIIHLHDECYLIYQKR